MLVHGCAIRSRVGCRCGCAVGGRWRQRSSSAITTSPDDGWPRLYVHYGCTAERERKDAHVPAVCDRVVEEGHSYGRFTGTTGAAGPAGTASIRRKRFGHGVRSARSCGIGKACPATTRNRLALFGGGSPFRPRHVSGHGTAARSRRERIGRHGGVTIRTLPFLGGETKVSRELRQRSQEARFANTLQ